MKLNLEELMLKGVAYTALISPPWNVLCWSAQTALQLVAPSARPRSWPQRFQEIVLAPVTFPIMSYLLGSYYLGTDAGRQQLVDAAQDWLDGR